MYNRIKIINEHEINRIKEIYVCLWKGKVKGITTVRKGY